MRSNNNKLAPTATRLVGIIAAAKLSSCECKNCRAERSFECVCVRGGTETNGRAHMPRALETSHAELVVMMQYLCAAIELARSRRVEDGPCGRVPGMRMETRRRGEGGGGETMHRVVFNSSLSSPSRSRSHSRLCFCLLKLSARPGSCSCYSRMLPGAKNAGIKSFLPLAAS